MALGDVDDPDVWHADILSVLSDPLDDDCRRTLESSLVLHTVGARGLSRGGSFVRRLPVQGVGELRSRVLEKLGASNSGRKATLDRRLLGTDGPVDDDPDKQFGLAGSSLLSNRSENFPHPASCGKAHKKPSLTVVSGPASALPVCRKMLQNGGDPKRWFAEWSKELSVGRKDRAWHDMHS